MAAVARRRGASEVALLVAVVTRKRAVQAIEVATHARVVEARGRKGPLGVAGPASWGQRVGVNIILSVAVDA